MMKRYLLFCQLALLSTTTVHAQFGAGTQGFFIEQDTQVAIDGLTLKPSTDLNIDSRNLTISNVPIPGSPPGINKVYTFSSSLSFVGTVGFFYLNTQLNGNTESILQVAYGTSTFVTTTGSTVNTTDHYISKALAAPVSFTSVTAAQPGALPVTLIDFTARRIENFTLLNWQTSEEKNSEFFEVQQSTDAKNWNILGRIAAARESNGLKAYSFQDQAARSGMQYYRLKMVDEDGSFAYSAIRNADLGSVELVKAYPNPVVDQLKIGTSVALANLKLTDLSGKALLELSKPQSGAELSMKNYPAGIYLVQFKTVDGQSQVVKIVKQ